MSQERRQKVEAVLSAALELSPGARATFLTEACGDDVSLRREVESLLAAYETDDFLEITLSELSPQRLDRADSLVGRKAGPYQIIKLLGLGGMGQIYLAEDTRLHRKVALKLLPRHFNSYGDPLRRFRQEARAVSALNHPNIITIYEIGEVEDTHFIATEYVEGETLRQRTRHGPLTVGEAIDVASQVARALSAAHAAGIVHRDVKPENVMVRSDGHVKVLDFGISKQLRETFSPDESEEAEHDASEASGVVVGTASYMSPEQARGAPVDGRSDIFSLGALLYESIAGRHAFSGPTYIETISQVLSFDPPPPSQFNPSVSPELDRIALKALAKRPDDRYQTAEEMASDLKRVRRSGKDTASDIERISPRGEETADTSYLRSIIMRVAKAISIARGVGRRSRATRGARGSDVPQSPPVFYLLLEGERVKGNLVEFDAEVDLVFNHGAPPDLTMATLRGRGLETARANNTDLGITVVPRGFIFRDARWHKIARFEQGRLVEPVKFLLRSLDKSAVAPSDLETAGFYIVFDIHGYDQYGFFLAAELVRSIKDERGTVDTRAVTIELDLEKCAQDVRLAEEILSKPVEVTLP